MDDDQARVYARPVTPTRWVDEGFLADEGLLDDFQHMVNNTGLTVLASLHYDTFDVTTWEFLASFEDTLQTHGRNCTVSFTMSGIQRHVSFQAFYDSFGFSVE